MSLVTLYGFAGSTYVQTARMTCLEKGVDHELEGLEFRSPSHARLHPFLKMPAARVHDVPLFDTLAICVAIDSLGADPRLVPDGPAQARMFQWVSVANAYAYDALVGSAHGDDKPSSEAVTAISQMLVLLNEGLGKEPYFAGKQLSLADLFLFPMLRFAAANIDGFDRWIAEQKALSSWLSTMHNRPSATATLPNS